ncbi:hypothetical protein PsYK624_075670 [Phanerochaete sordida]|uniref:Uncharacterized protein n=1 Tax=Phanerochaete sordida TaxID=48140 RepID=A0A9P3G8W5_9APHY|nr:hypothetical protein PsYK624_075670 [Phanerochaete sordida]
MGPSGITLCECSSAIFPGRAGKRRTCGPCLITRTSHSPSGVPRYHTDAAHSLLPRWCVCNVATDASPPVLVLHWPRSVSLSAADGIV